MSAADLTPRDYVNSVENAKLRAIAAHIRTLIREVSPEVDESVRYGMLDFPGVGNLAVQDRYVALYMDQRVVADNAELIARVDSARSCLRFRSLEEVPDSDLRELFRRALAEASRDPHEVATTLG